MEILIGFGALVACLSVLIGIVYGLGILPKLWLGDSVDLRDFGENIKRGVLIILCLIVIAVVITGIINISLILGSEILTYIKSKLIL